MLKQISKELRRHVPFTMFGAVTGIIIMIIMVFFHASKGISNAIFYTLHPLHVVLSALATTAMYKLHGKGKLWIAVLIGYTGSIGIATLSDAVIPYLGGGLLNVPMEFHVPFIETAKMPFIGIAKWKIVNSAAILGIVIGYLKPKTKFPHFGHVLLSTWASLFHIIMALGGTISLTLSIVIFPFLFIAVLVPCCMSDIIFPLLFTGDKSK